MSLNLHVINTGKFKLDGGAMFGVVPKSIWSRTNPPDSNNMCSWAMRCLLIEENNKKILIDTGIGTKQNDKFFKHFYLHGDDTLINSLKLLSISPNEITHVLFTHLHFDHCGGAIEKNNNQLELVFKNAIHLSNEQHWKLANKPNDRERASFLNENFDLIQAENKLKFINEGSLFKFMDIDFYHGHTLAQMIPKIKFRNKIIVFMADLLPSIGHIPLAYVMGYDTQPLLTLKEKSKFLNEAADQKYILFLQHDYQHECCTVKHTNKGVRLDKCGKLSEFLTI